MSLVWDTLQGLLADIRYFQHDLIFVLDTHKRHKMVAMNISFSLSIKARLLPRPGVWNKKVCTMAVGIMALVSTVSSLVQRKALLCRHDRNSTDTPRSLLIIQSQWLTCMIWCCMLNYGNIRLHNSRWTNLSLCYVCERRLSSLKASNFTARSHSRSQKGWSR